MSLQRKNRINDELEIREESDLLIGDSLQNEQVDNISQFATKIFECFDLSIKECEVEKNLQKLINNGLKVKRTTKSDNQMLNLGIS